MKKYCYLMIFCALCFEAAAVDWPMPGVLPDKDFAQNEAGKPLVGMSLASEGSVYAADSGEVIFIDTAKNRVSGLPSPLGSWLALDFDNGITAIYARYGAAEDNLSQYIEKQQIIAQAGATGAQEKAGLYFSLYDRTEHRWLNPAAIITQPEIKREISIGAVQLKNAEGQMARLGQTRVLKQGRYSIFAEINGLLPEGGAKPFPPYTLSAFVNGADVGTFTFENFAALGGILTIYRNALLPVSSVYDIAGYYGAGEFWFSRGLTVLEVLASDHAGRTRTASYRFTVE